MTNGARTLLTVQSSSTAKATRTQKTVPRVRVFQFHTRVKRVSGEKTRPGSDTDTWSPLSVTLSLLRRWRESPEFVADINAPVLPTTPNRRTGLIQGRPCPSMGGHTDRARVDRPIPPRLRLRDPSSPPDPPDASSSLGATVCSSGIATRTPRGACPSASATRAMSARRVISAGRSETNSGGVGRNSKGVSGVGTRVVADRVRRTTGRAVGVAAPASGTSPTLAGTGVTTVGVGRGREGVRMTGRVPSSLRPRVRTRTGDSPWTTMTRTSWLQSNTILPSCQSCPTIAAASGGRPM